MLDGVKKLYDMIDDRFDGYAALNLSHITKDIEEEVEREWVKAPIGYDGNPLMPGQVVNKIIDGRYTGIDCHVEGVSGDSVFVSYDDNDCGKYGPCFYECMANMFKQKPKTIEDILDEIIVDLMGEGFNESLHAPEIRKAVIDKYAKQLRLASD